MSFDAENIEHEDSVEALLRAILLELKKQRILLEEISGFTTEGITTDELSN